MSESKKGVWATACRGYESAGYPLLPLTRLFRGPLRWFYHRSPLLRHDSKRYLKPRLLTRLHALLVKDHPPDFAIYRGQLNFRSYGSEMSVQGYYVGEIEHHLVQFVVGRLRPGFIMIDVGAHHGVFTLVVSFELKKRGWPGHVYAFEPGPENYALLQYNLARNGLEAYATLSPTAVGSECGSSALLLNPRDNSDNRLELEGGRSALGGDKGANRQQVVVTNLDQFCDRLSEVHLIKVDVQGHEPLVLAGATRLIERHRPIILVEAVQGWPSTAQIRDFLVTHGYRIHGVSARAELCALGGPEAFVSWDWVGIPE